MLNITEEELKKLINENEIKILELQKENEILKQRLSSQIKNLSIQDKINIFADYFRGRTDVYPHMYIKNGKVNYAPTCNNFWKANICNKRKGFTCKNCQYRDNVPLTLEVIKNHMYTPNNVIGIYPMLEGDTCYFLAFDFDNRNNNLDVKDDVLAFASICDKYDIPIGIEKSRSGKGYHIWIFFKDNIKALTARKLGSLLLSKTMEIKDSFKITSFDRMFPNQDFLQKDGYGNLISLPFQNEASKYGNTLFVDRNFLKIDNQFEFLKSIKKLTLDEVFEKINLISNETIDISCEISTLKNDVKNKKKNHFKYPNDINIILSDMIYIDKANLDAGVKSCFRRLATFANPEFYRKQRMRLSVYNTPMIIDCSEEDDKYLKIPRGTFEYLESLCKENNVKMNIKDKRNKGHKIDVNFNGILEETQLNTLNKMLEYDNGVLSAPPAFGKTVTSCNMIAKVNTNTLVLVPRLPLINQWQKSIKNFLGLEEVGEYSSRKKNLTNNIDVASIQSIWNKGSVLDIVNNYGMIIIDECHHAAAYTFEKVINKCNAKYVYGMSATPERENGHTPIVFMQCGNIRCEINALEFNQNLKIPMKIIVKNSHLNFTNKQIDNYELNEINDFIAKDVVRTDNIVKDIKTEFDNNKNILVLTERIRHLNEIYDKLKKYTDNVFKYQGGIGKKVLKEYEKLNEKINENGENKIIVATGSCLGEGFDDSKLDTLFLTMPSSGKTKITQYLGRLHRKNEDKKEIIVYDYVDDNYPKTRNMFIKRKKTYEKLGYEIIENEEGEKNVQN